MKKIILTLMLSTIASVGIAAEPAHWQVDTNKSSITWTANYGGKPVIGTLPIESADIVFDPDQLATSHASVKIAVGKVHSDDADAQENLPGAEWFDSAQYPLAEFTSTTFTKTGDHYAMEGTLTLRGKSAPVNVPFTIAIAADNSAHIEARAVLKRTEFGVGQGDWAKTDTVADDVQVKIVLEAKRIAPQ